MSDKTETLSGEPPPIVELPRHGGPRWPVETGPFLGLVGVVALFLIILASRGGVGGFVGKENLQLLMNQNAIRMVVVLGMLIVIVTGGIDLSVGSVVGLTATAAWFTYVGVHGLTGSPALAGVGAVLAAVAVGGACGAVNGLTISYLRLTPFVATLGMMSVARGLTCWVLNDTNRTLPETPGWMDDLQRAGHPYLFFDPGVWSALILAAVVAAVLRYTVFGRYCYAIGSNEATARLCGVNVTWNKVAAYTAAGMLTGWAGLLAFAQTSGGAQPEGGMNLELEVIAAAVIGGASLRGGQGTVLGVLLGVMVWGVVENGVNHCGVPPEVKYVLSGVIVVVNTAVSQWRRKRSG